jgi:hypothetical protein
MNYNWKVLYIKTKDYPNMPLAIHSARVEYVGTNADNKSGRHEITIPFPPPTIESFTPYNQLTESTIIGWFENNFSQEHWNNILESIEEEISNQIKKQEFLPW